MIRVDEKEVLDLADLTVRIVTLMRDSVPHLADERADLRDLRALREYCRYSAERRRQTDLFLTFPGTLPGTRILRVRAKLSPVIDRFVEFRFAARCIHPHAVDRRAYWLSAALCTLPREMRRTEGWIWFRSAWQSLLDVDTTKARDAAVIRAAFRVAAVQLRRARKRAITKTPAHAFEAGLRSSVCGDHLTAVRWFRRSRVLADALGEKELVARAIAALGREVWRMGENDRARNALIRALELTRDTDLRGRVLHDLTVLAIEDGDDASVRHFSRKAFAAYGSSHRDLPSLACDLANHWMRTGGFGDAISVMESALPVLPTYRAIILTHGNIARAAGAVGDREKFEHHFRIVARAVRDTTRLRDGVADAGVQAAAGALHFDEVGRAGSLLQRVRLMAAELGELDTIREADELIERIGDDEPQTCTARRPDDHLRDALVDALSSMRRKVRP